jgi:hypothetical protein
MNVGAIRNGLPIEHVAQKFDRNEHPTIKIGCGDFRLPKHGEAQGEHYLRIFGARYAIELMAITAMIMTNPSYNPGRHIHEIEDVFDVLEEADLLPHDHYGCKFIMGNVAVSQAVADKGKLVVGRAYEINPDLDKTTINALAGIQEFLLDSGYIAISEAILEHRERAGHKVTKMRNPRLLPSGGVVNMRPDIMKRPIPNSELRSHNNFFWVDEHAAQKVAEVLEQYFGKDVIDRTNFMATFAMFTAATSKLVTPKGREDTFEFHIID